MGSVCPRTEGVVSTLTQRVPNIGLRNASACGEVKAMNASVASFDITIAAVPAGMAVAASGLNNNANNNTRHYGWAGV
jgi:hypothetical protein